jgi:hypothetical protein
MMSNSRCPAVVVMPVSVIRRIGVSGRLIRWTRGVVVGLVVAGAEGRTAGSVTRARDELLRGVRVVHGRADAVREELAPFLVDLWVGGQVGVALGELAETAAVPHLLEHGLALLGSVVGGQTGGAAVHKSGGRGVEDLPDPGEIRVQLSLFVHGDRVVVQRGDPVGRHLVDGQIGHVVGDGGHELDAAGTGADLGDPPAAEVHGRAGPAAGVVLGTGETLLSSVDQAAVGAVGAGPPGCRAAGLLGRWAAEPPGRWTAG